MRVYNIIYGLIDPRTLLIRYVGLSVTGMDRPRAHRRPTEMARHTHKSSWVKSLAKDGLTFDIVVLDATEKPLDLPAKERWWIAFGRACGWPLTNLTDGGEGRIGHTPTAETRAKMSAVSKGKPKSAEARANMSIGQRGRVHSADTRAKISAAFKGKPLAPDTRRKMSASRTGLKRTAVQCANIAAAVKASHARRRTVTL